MKDRRREGCEKGEMLDWLKEMLMNYLYTIYTSLTVLSS